MSKQRITSPDLRKYRIELPNLYDDADFDVYEFRLLAHYVRRGTCFEAVRTTAKQCKMNHATVIRKRDSLEKKGYIRTWQEEDGGTIHVEVIDRWLENYQIYSGAQVERGGAQVERGGAQVELKKEPIKKEPTKNETLVQVWEKYVGTLLTSTQMQFLYDLPMDWDAHTTTLPDTHPDRRRAGREVVEEAIKITGLQEVRKISYTTAIVDRWMKDGYKVDTREKKTQQTNNSLRRAVDGGVYGA